MVTAPQLEILYTYTVHSTRVGRSKISKFCSKHYPSKRKKTMGKLIREAQDNIIFGPRLFTPQDIHVEFVPYRGIPALDVLEIRKKNPSFFSSMVLVGSYSLITFQRTQNPPLEGPLQLTYAESIVPSLPAQKNILKIDPTLHEPQELPQVNEPKNWDELDWRIYYRMNNPNESSSKAASDLYVSYKTVLSRFYKIQKDCTIWMPFLPQGYKNYRQFVITLKTDYEVGFRKELQKLDRSSYIYKIGNMLMIHLFLDDNSELDFLLDLEKKGVIHSVSVSIPLRYCNRFW